MFAAWASQAAKAQWFGPDDDSGAVPVTEEHSLDFRVGGRERITGAIPNGPRFEYDAVYADIVENTRVDLVLRHASGRPADLRLGRHARAHRRCPAARKLVLTEQGAYLDGLDTNDQRRQGTEDLLDKLGEFLAPLRCRKRGSSFDA